MSKPNNTTRPVCLTDGEHIYYPQGAGVVRSISLADLSFAESDDERLDFATSEPGILGMVFREVMPDILVARPLAPVAEDAPPARWTDPKDPLGFPEDFADLLGAWLDWCDEQEAAAEEAVAA